MEPYHEYLKSAKDLLEKCSFHYERSKTLRKSIEENAEKYKDSYEECNTLKTSLDAFKTENNVLNKTCQDLKLALDVTTKEKNLLNEESKKLKLSLNVVTEKNSKLEKECTASELCYSEVVNENANLKNSLNEMKNANAKLTIKCNDLLSSLNDSRAKLEDTKEKWKLSNQIVKKLKKERKVAKENLAKKMSEMLGTVFKPSTNFLSLSSENTISEVVLSSDDEDDLLRVVSASQCDDKVNILPKSKSTDGSGKPVQIGDHEPGNRTVPSDKEGNHHLLPPTAAASFQNDQERNINTLPRRSTLTVSPNVTPILSSFSKTKNPSAESFAPSSSSVVGMSSNRATSTVLLKKDIQNVERSISTSIPITENKSKTAFSPTKGKQENSPTPNSATNSPNNSNQTITLSPTSSNSLNSTNRTNIPSPSSPRRNNPSPIPSSSILTSREVPFKDNPASPNSKANEKCNQSSPTPSVQKTSNPITPVASLRKDDFGRKGSLVSPIFTLNNQSKAEPTSPKDNERSILPSPVSIASSHQNRPNQVTLLTSPIKDIRDTRESPTSAIAVPKNLSPSKSVTITGNKEKSRTSAGNSQNDENITSSSLRVHGHGNVSINSPSSIVNKTSRASLSPTRAQNSGLQLEQSSRGNDEFRSKASSDFFIGSNKSTREADHTEHSYSADPHSDSILRNPIPNENEEPAYNKELDPEDLLSLHFSSLRRSPSKTLKCNENSKSGIISGLDSEVNNSTLPSSSVKSIDSSSSNELTINFPIVSIPRIDEVTDLVKMQSPRENRKSKRTSINDVAGPSKIRRSSGTGKIELSKLSKNSQRLIKLKTFYEYSCSQCSLQFASNSDLN